MAVIVETSSEVGEYEKFRKPIQEIIDFTNTIDEVYREKCFEVLLNHYLLNKTDTKNSHSTSESKNFAPQTNDYPLELKTFLEQYTVPEETINKLFLKEKGETKPIYQINEKRKAIAQIEIALLAAFENALTTPNGAFEFSMKTARQRCTETRRLRRQQLHFQLQNKSRPIQQLRQRSCKINPDREDRTGEICGMALKTIRQQHIE